MKKRKAESHITNTRKSRRLFLGSLEKSTSNEVEGDVEYEFASGDSDFAEEIEKKKKTFKKNSKKKKFTKVSFKFKVKESNRKKKKSKKKDVKIKNHPDKLVTRQSPYQLVSILSCLTTKQQEDLKDMGFGSVVGFKIKQLPMSLALELVDRLDASECQMMVNQKLTKIRKKDVKDILGFPMGDVPIKSVKRAGMGDTKLAMSWKTRYPCPAKGGQRIYLSDVKEMIKSHPQGGTNFKYDILLAIMTVMGEGISCGTVNQRVLSSLKSEDDIKKMDWCGYVLDCLRRSKDKWKKDDEKSWYTGPLLFLVVWYAQEISKKKKRTPAMLYWTSEELKRLESMEFSEGNYETNEESEHKSSFEIEKEFNEVSPTPIDIDDSQYLDPSDKKEDGEDEAEDGKDEAEDSFNFKDSFDFQEEQQQTENDQQQTENDQQPTENEQKSSENNKAFQKEVFVGSLDEVYEMIRELKEDFYERMQSGLTDFPGDTLVMEKIKSVKEKWLKDILKDKRRFEEEIEKEKQQETPEDIDGNKNNPDEVISLGSSEDSTSNEVEVDVQSGDEGEENENKQPAPEEFMINKQMEEEKNDYDSTPLTECQILNENEEESNSPTLTRVIEVPVLCDNLEMESIEKVNEKNGQFLELLADVVCKVNYWEIPTVPSFTFDGEFQIFFSRIPFLNVEPQIHILKTLSFEEQFSLCNREKKIENESGNSRAKGIESGDPVTPVEASEDTWDKEIQVYSPVPLSFGKIMKKLMLPEKRKLNDEEIIKKDEAGKGKREKKPSDSRKSPWRKRVVDIKTDLTSEEIKRSDTIFAAIAGPYDIIFSRKPVMTCRFMLESLILGSYIHYGVIDTWACYLNFNEELKSKKSLTRIFFPTNILMKTKLESQDEYAKTYNKFQEDMDRQLSVINQKITDAGLLFFPICEHQHYYLMCYNLKTDKCYIIDNLASGNSSLERYNEIIPLLKELVIDYLAYKQHPNLHNIVLEKTERLKMQWRTQKNAMDCGVFLMRHMETFMGNGLSGLKAGFKKEGELQQKQLNCLRIIYLKTILLSDVNTLKMKVESDMNWYMQLNENEKQKLKVDALKRIERRIEARSDEEFRVFQTIMKYSRYVV